MISDASTNRTRQIEKKSKQNKKQNKKTMSPPSPNPNTSGQIHSHRLFLPRSAAAVLFGALGARGAPVAIGGGACGCCLGLVSARELAGTTTTAEGGAGAEEDGAAVDLVAVSIEGPADATAAAAAEMISVARRAAEEAAGGRNNGSAVIVSAEDAACGGKWTYCDETGARRGPFPWPQVLRWARRGFWQPGFPLRDVASGGILPSALAVAAMEFLFPAVAQASQAQAAQAQKQQLQQQQQQQMMTHHQQHQQHQHLQQQHQHHHEQPTAMATEAPPLAVPAQPRPSPVIHHLFAAAPEEEMMAVAAGSSSAVASDAQRTQPQQQKQHPQQPGKSRMNIADALSILGRSGVGGGSGGGGGRRRGGGGGGIQQASTPLPPPPPPAVPVPVAAYAPAVAAYRPPAAAAAAAAAAGAASGSGRQNAIAAAAGGTSFASSADPRSLAAALDAAVVSSLAPAVALRLRAVHGDLWLDVLPEPLPWRTPETVLSVLKSTWKSSFAKGFGSPSAEAARERVRAARAGQGPAVSEAACALADLVRDFPGNGGKGSSEEAAAASAALARARAAAAAAASKAASAGWI